MRRRLATDEQRAEVLRRHDAGESLRAIAAATFGSERLKDRVARIIRRRADERELVSGMDTKVDVDELLDTGKEELDARLEALAGELQTDEERVRKTRRLLELQRRRYEERLAKGELTRASELLALIRLELLLDNVENFFRLREMTRESPGHG